MTIFMAMLASGVKFGGEERYIDIVTPLFVTPLFVYIWYCHINSTPILG
jgi:hypothetical protein